MDYDLTLVELGSEQHFLFLLFTRVLWQVTRSLAGQVTFLLPYWYHNLMEKLIFIQRPKRTYIMNFKISQHFFLKMDQRKYASWLATFAFAYSVFHSTNIYCMFTICQTLF